MHDKLYVNFIRQYYIISQGKKEDAVNLRDIYTNSESDYLYTYMNHESRLITKFKINK